MIIQEKKHRNYILIVAISGLYCMIASEQKNNSYDHESNSSEVILSKEMKIVVGRKSYDSIKPGTKQIRMQKSSGAHKLVACCCCPFIALMNACRWCDEYIDGVHDCCSN